MSDRRRLNRLQRRLRKAERLRRKGSIDDLAYALIALDVIDQLTDGKVRRGIPGTPKARAYEHMNFGIEGTGALNPHWEWPKYDFAGAEEEYGPYRGALGVISDSLDLEPFERSAPGPNFVWTPEIARRTRHAVRQLNPVYRWVGRVERWLEEHRAAYPLVSTAAGNLLLAVLSAFLGFLAGAFLGGG